ncbi:MAG TPA: AMP-binding protein [Candidatus Dormibacteraeota bacterium]|nr:AMP-binding protein [Candidatus Dormibacteraeota bacterium]
MDEDVFWRPNAEQMARSRMASLMRRMGAADYADLVRKGAEDIDTFWKEAVEDIGIEWYEPYKAVRDSSRGIEWTTWFTGGRLNLVHNCLDKQVRDRPNAVALISEYEDGKVKRYTYTDLDREVVRLAAAMKALGVERGDTVGLFLPMIPEVVFALLATAKIGAVFIPLFSGYGPDAVAVRLADCEAKLLVTADGFLRRGSVVPMKETADAALAGAPSVQNVLVVRRTGRDVPWVKGRDVWYDEAVKGTTPGVATESMASEDPCMLIYTSGTTGKPKGCVHVHCGFPIKGAQDMAHAMDFGEHDRMFWFTDIGWMMGPWEIMSALALGGSFVTYEGSPDYPGPDRIWDIVEQHKVTHLGISPTAVRSLMRFGEKPLQDHDLSSLRMIGSTGEPWNPDPWKWAFQNIGGGRIPLLNYSGGTEISGGILGGNFHTVCKPCAFSGPVPGMAVDVVDSEGNPVRGEVGELVLRQPWPGMTRGFWRDPERYIATYWSRWPGLWYHGDFAELDDDGLWYILGRSDDTIKVAGKRIGPAEVESALVSHPAVQEAAAIGVPDELKGEKLVGFVILRPGEEPRPGLEEELKAQVARALGKSLKPAAVHPVTDLPKTRNAKIMRRVIRAAYLGENPGDLTSLENPAAIDGITALR